MTKPIGVRIDKETRTQIEKDAKKSGIALSTYASKILNDWTNTYKPSLDAGSVLIKDPKYEDFLQNLEFWISTTNQRLSVLGNHPTKHVISHSWGFAYSKITCNVLKRVWESLGFRFEEIELKENMFSYYLHE
jgi:hypothetical protein